MYNLMICYPWDADLDKATRAKATEIAEKHGLKWWDQSVTYNEEPRIREINFERETPVSEQEEKQLHDEMAAAIPGLFAFQIKRWPD